MAPAKSPTKKRQVRKQASHPQYKEMVAQAIINLKERSGSSRTMIKKYIHSNFSGLTDSADKLIKAAIKKGVESGEFVQPKGPSGTVKLADPDKKAAKASEKKDERKASDKKAAASTGSRAKTTSKRSTSKAASTPTAKATATKKSAATKKAAPKKAVAKKAAPKKAVPKKTTAAKVAQKKEVVKKPAGRQTRTALKAASA
ncbi:linker histone H1 and H5 family-domain-containing protein [Gaertneriomyces semiglobifer]|nr:linker histone H1 and H5 family-domain-containing protein [Gaertneriomyces semiglobifer]